MTGDDEALSERAIEIARNLNRRAAEECQKRGLSTEDVTIAALYSAFDLATGFAGNQFAGVEWLRSGLDMIERQVMQEAGTVQ